MLNNGYTKFKTPPYWLKLNKLMEEQMKLYSYVVSSDTGFAPVCFFGTEGVSLTPD